MFSPGQCFFCARLVDGELSSFQVPMASQTGKEREREIPISEDLIFLNLTEH